MNRAEREFVGVLAKSFLKLMCREMPLDEKIRFGRSPYPASQMNARAGARFTHDFISAYTSTTDFLEKIDGLVAPEGKTESGRASGFKVVISAKDVPLFVRNLQKLQPAILTEAIHCHFYTLYQADSWPHRLDCYQEIMEAANKAGFARQQRVDLTLAKEWAGVCQDATAAAVRLQSENLSPAQSAAILNKFAYRNAKDLYDLFDREHGTKGGVIWVWTNRVAALTAGTEIEFDPVWTGGPFE